MSKEAMKLALEALTATMSTHGFREHIEEAQDKAIKALEEALAKQEQHALSSRVNDVRVHIEHGKQHDEAMKRITDKQEQGEPVAHAVVAGCLYDFMGWITSRRTRITLSDRDNASPAADAIVDFSKMRGLKLDDALVESWQTALATTPQQRTWVGLTDKQIDEGLCRTNYAMQTSGAWRDGVEWATQQLKERNT